jgi:hypothetical protein
MASQRTTLILDEETRKAARELATRDGCSVSEAIRRAVIRQRDSAFGIPPEGRKERMKRLQELFKLFEGHDAEEEIRQLKAQDEGF